MFEKGSERKRLCKNVSGIILSGNATYGHDSVGLIFADLEVAARDVSGTMRNFAFAGEHLGAGVVDVERRR
eukprot:scaffold8815_cov137-Isochrysis_galbana.AAC.2